MATQFFRTSNYIEAGLWLIIAGGFAIYGVTKTSDSRAWIACVAFAAFGVSDIIEASTGAWWRPWWLLVGKGVCLIVFAWLLVDHIRRRRAGS